MNQRLIMSNNTMYHFMFRVEERVKRSYSLSFPQIIHQAESKIIVLSGSIHPEISKVYAQTHHLNGK